MNAVDARMGKKKGKKKKSSGTISFVRIFAHG